MNAQKIISLSVSNFMRVSAVDIELSPAGELVILAGDNEQGKSSVIKAIEYVLGGKRSDIQRPIRDGSNEAKVVATLTDYVVTRTTTSNGSTGFKVTTRDKRAVSSPQTILDGFLCALSFDPLEFHRQATKEPARAVETLKKLAGLDFTKLDAERKTLYDERTDSNRGLAQSRARAEGLVHDASVPAKEIETADLAKELSAAQETNRSHRKHREVFADCQQKQKTQDESIERIKVEIEKLRTMLSVAEKSRAEFAAVLDADTSRLLVDIDESAIISRMSSIGATNAKVRANKTLADLDCDIAVDERNVVDLNYQIQQIDSEKERLLTTAKFPVAGISFNDAGVVLGGVPWAQCSSAQRLKATTAIGIALNPGLRAILIREGGNDLDKNSLAIMSQIAKEADIHIIMERCQVGATPNEIVIEDGHIKTP